MVIKLRSIINKTISIGVCILLGVSIYKKCTQEPYAPIDVHADTLLTDNTAQELTAFVQQHVTSLKNNTFSSSLIDQFPCVASYQVTTNPNGVLSCEIEAAQPTLTINKTWALTGHGRIAPTLNFSEHTTQSLPDITMPHLAITPVFCQFIQKMPASLLHQYHVVWLNEQEAFLRDPAQPFFSIRFNVHAIPDQQTMQKCLAIKQDMEQRGIFVCLPGKKKPQHWIADIRFKNQIIVSQNVEGNVYG